LSSKTCKAIFPLQAASLRFPVTSAAYQMQSGGYPYPSAQRPSAPYLAPAAPHGFGPRNMQPRGEGGYTRLAPDYPVPRPRQDYGVSRKVQPVSGS